jgi:DNA-binding response OmpR family regulator
MPQESMHASTERRRPAQALRVIVADDDRDTADTLAKFLEGEGHVVHRIYSGKEVLPTVRIVRPDAVILDVALPAMSGYALAQAIRESFTDVRRPLLIAISGVWKDFPDRRVAEQVGFDHYLVKPADPAAVLALLRNR